MVNQYLQFLRTTILIQVKIDYSICLEAVRLNLISLVERSLQSQNPATRLQAQGPNPLMVHQSPHMGPQNLLMVLRAKPNLLTKLLLMQSKLNKISTSTNVRPEISSMRNIPSFVIYYLFTHEILLRNSQMNSLLYNHFVKICH